MIPSYCEYHKLNGVIWFYRNGRFCGKACEGDARCEQLRRQNLGVTVVVREKRTLKDDAPLPMHMTGDDKMAQEWKYRGIW